MTDKTHFGFDEVAPEEKARRVRGVFDSVASRYDLMNDLMSAGLHRLWKRFAVEATGVRAGMRVLDLAGGTGDLARLFARKVGPTGEVVLTDINGAMLAEGRDKLLNAGRARPDRPMRRRAPAVRRRPVRLRQHRIRLAQRDAQGDGPGRDASRAPSLAASPPCSSSRASGNRWRPPTTGTAST